MTDKTKKIIAREGLLLIFCLFCGFTGAMGWGYPYNGYLGLTNPHPPSTYFFYAVAVYFLLIVIRFIIWAVRTLKEK